MADDETPPGPAARRASSRGSSLGLGAAGQVELKQKKLDKGRSWWWMVRSKSLVVDACG